MGNEKWRYLETLAEAYGRPIAERHQPDILIPNELVPWTVCREKLKHSRHRVDGYVGRSAGLMAEVHDSGVVADVRVRKEHSVQSELTVRGRPVQLIQLFTNIRRRIKQILVPRLCINHRDGTGQPSHCRVLPGAHTVWLVAVGLRVSSVLSDAKNLQVNFRLGRGECGKEEQAQAEAAKHEYLLESVQTVYDNPDAENS